LTSNQVVLTFLTALAAGAFYWSRGDNYGSQADVTAITGGLFVSLLFLGFVNFQLVIPVTLFERRDTLTLPCHSPCNQPSLHAPRRPVFYRERAARCYSVLSWALAAVDVELPWITFQVRGGGAAWAWAARVMAKAAR